ncbi:MAG: hypothetical protein ACQESW_11275 [Bacteroidota bacterium]
MTVDEQEGGSVRPKNKKMKISAVIFGFILLCTYSVAQTSMNDSHFIIEGECHEVIEHLSAQVENDSVAVVYFLENYTVYNYSVRILKQKRYNEVIDFFKRPKNKHYWCRKKEFAYFPLLLDF